MTRYKYKKRKILRKIKVDVKIKVARTNHKKLSRTDRIKNWNKYMGNVWTGMCLICDLSPLTIFNFESAHVIARTNGGSNDIDNLRPTCGYCNSQMGTENLITFTKKFYPDAKILNTFPK